MRDLTEAISAAAQQSGTRQTIGAGISFGALPVPQLWPSMVAQTESQALQFYSTDVTPSPAATSAAVPPRGAKQVGATVATTAKSIQKWAYQALLTLEDYEQAPASVSNTLQTLLARATVAQESGAFAALDAAAAEPVPAASWVAAIAQGQAALVGKGHTPGLVVVAAADWAEIAIELAGSSGLATPSEGAILNVLGSRIAVSPSAPGGEAFVVDPSAVTTVLRDAGFFVTAVPATNEILCVADLLASTFVTTPTGVAAIAGPAVE